MYIFSSISIFIVSTKAEVRFNVHTADWIPEDVRQKIIEKVCPGVINYKYDKYFTLILIYHF